MTIEKKIAEKRYFLSCKIAQKKRLSQNKIEMAFFNAGFWNVGAILKFLELIFIRE